jgi:peroxiredoxin
MRPAKTTLLSLLLVSLLLAMTRLAVALEVGEKAPDFELDSTKGGKLKLSSLKGKNVLINFYAFDYSPTWIKHLQASGSDDSYPKFQAENTEVLGIAATTRFSQAAFADFTKISYPLLSGGTDVTSVHKVMRAYGVLDEQRLNAKRSYVIIDKEGVVRYVDIRPTNTEKDLLSTEQLLNEVKKVNKGS